jgi:hypothetical protein
MFEIEAKELVAQDRLLALSKRPDRAEGVRVQSRYTHVGVTGGTLSTRCTDNHFYLISRSPVSGTGEIPEIPVRTAVARAAFAQIGRAALRAGGRVRIAQGGDGAILLSSSVLDTALTPEPMVNPFPAPAPPATGTGTSVGLLDLADSLRFLSRGHPPDVKNDNAHICTLFPDGRAMAFHLGATLVTSAPCLTAPLSLRRPDARRFAAWLATLKTAAPAVSTINLAATEVAGDAYWCAATVGADHAVYFPSARREFPRQSWDASRTIGPNLRCVVTRAALFEVAEFLKTYERGGEVVGAFVAVGAGRYQCDMMVHREGAPTGHSARIPVISYSPDEAAPPDFGAFRLSAGPLYEGVRRIPRIGKVGLEFRPTHRKLTLVWEPLSWAQSEGERLQADISLRLGATATRPSVPAVIPPVSAEIPAEAGG